MAQLSGSIEVGGGLAVDAVQHSELWTVVSCQSQVCEVLRFRDPVMAMRRCDDAKNTGRVATLVPPVRH